jgi:hypothetical protein
MLAGQMGTVPVPQWGPPWRRQLDRDEGGCKRGRDGGGGNQDRDAGGRNQENGWSDREMTT